MLLDFFCDGLEPGAASQASAEPTRPHRARSSGSELSSRELEVLRLLAGGESNAQIARRLRLSPHTVERHVTNIYRKINARGRADATAYALRHGLA